MDLCILLGCDYVESIKGVGPTRAFSMMKEHKCIEKILENLPEKLKANVPENWPFQDARELFLKPDVQPGSQIDVSRLKTRMESSDRSQIIIAQVGCTRRGESR